MCQEYSDYPTVERIRQYKEFGFTKSWPDPKDLANLPAKEITHYIKTGDMIRKVSDPKWHTDIFSTIMSRKHSFHKRCGRLMMVRTKK